MGEPRIVAVDQSTQSTKAFVFGPDGSTLARHSIPHRQIYPGAGLVEHDPAELLRNTVEAVERVVENAGTDPGDLVCLALTNQRETIVAWDRLTGEPVHNALVWQDDRGAGICGELALGGHEATIRERTGLRLDPYFSASKLAWLVRHSSRARRALESGTLMAGTIDAWLVWKLTGGRVFATDVSNASRTMLLDIRTRTWDAGLLRLFGLEGLSLPDPRRSDESFGEAALPGLGRSLPIRGVMGDSHAALFGHRGWNPGDAKSTFGTGSSLMCAIGPDARTAPEGIVLSISWGFRGQVGYVYEGNIHSSGYTLTWLRNNLGLFGSDEEATRLAAGVPDNGGVYLVPAFSGLGAPHWAHGIRASITGLSHGSDRRHVARAGLESIAYQTMDLVEAMNAGAPVPLRSLHVDGGPSRNAFLMQFLADMLGIPVLASGREELSALGAAWMGGIACGLWSPADDPETREAGTLRYLPAMPPERRDALVAGWRSAVARTLSRAES